MYTPEKRIIRSGYADLKFDGPDMDYDGWNRIIENFREDREKQYRETNDLYDLQSEQANSMNDVLKGTSGKDYEYLQRSIVESRDRLKSLYKGKKLKDTRSPEFQTELYSIRQDLQNKKNSINTFYEQVKAADAIVNNTPSLKKSEWQKYVNEQMMLPPDQRDTNFVNKVNTDPLFFNPYDYTAAILEKEKTADEQIQKETKDLILNYDAKYRPSLGRFENGEFLVEPSDDLIDRLLKTDKRFYNSMAGMLPPEQAKAMIDSGNTQAFNDIVKEQARRYVKGIAGFGPDLKQTGKTVKSWQYYKPSAADTKLKKEEEEVNVIQQRLQNNDSRAFDDMIGDFWRNFDLEYDSDGTTVNGVIAKYQKPHPYVKGKMVEDTEFIPVDPDDAGSVKQAINRIKYFANKDKKAATPKSTEPPKSKTYKTTDGKSYSHDDLLKKFKYTEAQIQQAIKNGTLK